MIALLQTLIKSKDHRKSRLHDRRGNRVPIAWLLLHGSKALGSWISLRLTGQRPVMPWISYAAIEVLQRKLSVPSSSVLEFGSGMSTLWFIEHAEHICSVEHDPEWFSIVNAQLENLGKGKVVDYRLAVDKTSYATCHAGNAELFDVLLFDGPWRTECLIHNMQRVKPGGYIYLDNADAESSSGEAGEIDRAVALLENFARHHGATIEFFTDFVPTCLFVSQGILVRMPIP